MQDEKKVSEIKIDYTPNDGVELVQADEEEDPDFDVVLRRFIASKIFSQPALFEIECECPVSSSMSDKRIKLDNLQILPRSERKGKKNYFKEAQYEIDLGMYCIKYKDWNIKICVSKCGDLNSRKHSLVLHFSPAITKEELAEFYTEAYKFCYPPAKDSQRITLYNFCAYEDNWDSLTSVAMRGLDSVFLRPGLAEEIVEDVERFRSEDERKYYTSKGIHYKRVYLFYSKPGQGKSSFILALASHFHMDLATLDWNSKMDDASLKIAFANPPSNSILLCEDVDVLIDQPGECNIKNKSEVTFSGLLNALDGITRFEGQIVILTTNNKNSIDQTLLRPGRIDMVCNFDITEDVMRSNKKRKRQGMSLLDLKNDQVGRMFLFFFPEQKNYLPKFLESTQYMSDVCMATFQSFFVRNRHCKNILKCLDDLREISASHNHEMSESQKAMYC